MKTWAVDEKNNLKIINGDFVFLYDNEAVLSVGKQIVETYKGEIPNYEILGVIDYNSGTYAGDALRIIMEIVRNIKELPAIKDVVPYEIEVKNNKLYYKLKILTIYSREPLTFSWEQNIREMSI